MATMLFFQSCREEVTPDFRPDETKLLTGTIWRLESARYEETRFNLKNSINDTVSVTFFDYRANFDSDLPVRVIHYFRDVVDNNLLTLQELHDESFYSDIRFYTPDSDIPNTYFTCPSLINDSICYTPTGSWNWLQSTLPLVRIGWSGGGMPLFLASSSRWENVELDYAITSLTNTELILGLREDRLTNDSVLYHFFEELRFVSVSSGLCDAELTVSSINPASGQTGTRVTLTGNFGETGQVLGVSLFADNLAYQAENLVQGSSELSFDVPSNAQAGIYNIRLKFENFDKTISQTFTVVTPAVATAWASGPALPDTRSYQFHFIIDGNLYVGGGVSGYNNHGDVWRIGSANELWESVASLPVPLAYANGVSLNGYGYVLGGGYWDDIEERYVFSDAVYRYNPETNQWAQVSTFPGGGRQKAIAGVQDGLIYFGGGSASGFNGDWWSFNPTTNTWVQIFENLFEIRFDLGARSFSANNRVYFGFGYEELPGGNIYRQRASAEGFDYAFGIPVEELGYEGFVAVLNDRLYTGGGFFHLGEGAFGVNNIWVERDFNSTSSSTPGTRRTDHIHPAGRGVSVVTFDSLIWLLGGDTNHDTSINQVSIYNPVADE
jgi:hypothetical protein